MRHILLALACAAAPFAANAEEIRGEWRLTHGAVAPWSIEAPIDSGFIGKRVTFGDTAVKAPAPIGCKNAKYEPTETPAEGLFQGGLPAPAGEKARALGFAEGPVKGARVTCDSGLWEFHFADDDTALFALDNVVWTMSRAHGARSRKGSPESVVEAFLEFHFNRDRGFTEEQATERKKWFTKSLATAVDAYFDREFPVDEVPPINGDPFTDTQEYPTRFAVREGERLKRVARVPVDFADGYSSRREVYILLKEAGGWRIDDIAYQPDGAFRESMLAPY